MINPEELDNRFAFHPAHTQHLRDTHSEAREQAQCLAAWINAYVPEGREKSLAITKVEEAMFWANAAIARNQEDVEAAHEHIDRAHPAEDI